METLKTVAAIGLIFVVLPVAILWLNDKLFSRTPSAKELETASRLYQQRLLNPDFEAVEKHLGSAVPPALRRVYEDKSEVQIAGFDIENPSQNDDEPESWYVAFFSPLDQQSIREAWPPCAKYLVFADDGCGNCYSIDPHVTAAEVQFYDHESGEFSSTGLTLEQFLSAPRSFTS